MNRLRKKWTALFLVITLFAGIEMPVSAATTTAKYGALLDSYSAGSGTFQLTDTSRMFVVSTTEPTGELLQTAQLINREFAAKGYVKQDKSASNLVWGPVGYAKTGDIILELDVNSGTGNEGYKLEVTGDTATVTAAGVDGLLYGANSLMKFFIVAGGKSLSGFTAADAPDTKERTVMLDTGRKYYTVEWICNFIRQISWMGYNSLQVHVSEDGGFRADFWDSDYYKGNFRPENDFSWLCGSYVQSWVKDPYRTDPDAGKYLTTEELIQICEVAKEYHIDIIPSFDSPAHMDYITWKFEQNYKNNKSYSFIYNGNTYEASSTNGCINYTGTTGASSPTWPNYTTIDITDGTMAKAFVFALYEDMADFFKEYAGSTDFSIGADEVNLTSYASLYPRTWGYSKFPGYINELNRMLRAKGYTCRMFNDFIGSTTYNQKNSKAVYEFDDNIEIMYWNSDFDPNAGTWSEPIWHVKFFWETNTGTTDNWGDGDRIVYNCIQTNTYYVLRVAASDTNYPNMDARNPANYNWTFYHSTEEDIYNEWYPANISERGVYVEDAADVPEASLGGAYFLIWNDYAALNTESEVWNDVKDNTGTSSHVYSLFDRMYSNIIKMWNSDINSTVSYSDYESVRDKFGYFPGFTSCSAVASLPAAETPTKAYLADHSALDELLKEPKISNDDYLYANYATYEAAYDNAVAVNANAGATADEISTAISNLKSAKAALKVNDLTIYYLETDGTIIKTATTHTPDLNGDYTVEVSEIEGYIIETVSLRGMESEIVSFTPNSDNTGGTLVGNIKGGKVIVDIKYRRATVSLEALEDAIKNADADEAKYTSDSWANYATALANATAALNAAKADSTAYTQVQIDGYLTALTSAATALEEKATDLTILEAVLENPIAEQGNYTDSTWSAYTTALANATNAKKNAAQYTQSEIDAFAAALVNAREALKEKGTEPETNIESIIKLTPTSRRNRPIGILVKTTADVNSITVTLEGSPVVLSNLTNGKAALEDGITEGKLWLAKFYAPSTEKKYTYTVSATTSEGVAVEKTVEVIVK